MIYWPRRWTGNLRTALGIYRAREIYTTYLSVNMKMTTEGKEVAWGDKIYIWSCTSRESPILISRYWYQHTPIRRGVWKKKRREKVEKEKKKIKESRKVEGLTNNQAKIITMMKKESWRKGFGENVGGHVIRRDPCSGKWTVVDVLVDEMMADINVFGPGGDDIGVGDSAGTLVIAENRKWFGGSSGKKEIAK